MVVIVINEIQTYGIAIEYTLQNLNCSCHYLNGTETISWLVLKRFLNTVSVNNQKNEL